MIWLTPQERKALWEEYPEVQEVYEEYNGILPEDDGAWERVAEHCHQIREQYQTMQVEVALLDVVWQLECLAKKKKRRLSYATGNEVRGRIEEVSPGEKSPGHVR